MMQESERALGNLLRYCRSEGWAGYDPYDALNSPLIPALYLNHRLPRTIFTQLLKRCPVNLRPVFGIRKGFNPKGLALALRAVILLAAHFRESLPQSVSRQDNVYPAEPADGVSALSDDFVFLMNSLDSVRSAPAEEACWGYNFDWQSRAFFAPRGTPNVVCTVFAAHAYLDWHEQTGNELALDTASRSCRFLLDRLNRTEGPDGFCFSYTPLDRSRVHNVNLLAAELLARVFSKTGEGKYREAAERAVEYTVGRQQADGSWLYGEAASQNWIDSFHTGFILVSLKHIGRHLETDRWLDNLRRGYDFYTERFFLADSTPRYYHDSLYPIDAHSSAQAVITFVEMTDLMPAANEKRKKSVDWAIRNLQAPEGFFYFQRSRFYTNKIPYMRWAQSWMLYALSLHFCRSEEGADG